MLKHRNKNNNNNNNINNNNINNNNNSLLIDTPFYQIRHKLATNGVNTSTTPTFALVSTTFQPMSKKPLMSLQQEIVKKGKSIINTPERPIQTERMSMQYTTTVGIQYPILNDIVQTIRAWTTATHKIRYVSIIHSLKGTI
jgi:hypothetical protein